VALGLSVIFISHKLGEVMAITSRVVVLRHGCVVGEVATADTDRHKLAEMMVGAEVAAPIPDERKAGKPRMTLSRVSTAPRGDAAGLTSVDLVLRAGQITGLAGVSGNGQSALADLIAGLERPSAGTLTLDPATPAGWSPRAALGAGIARIPEDRHKSGAIADFSLAENAVLECYADAPFSRSGWMNWAEADRLARRIIKSYDVRCPGPQARIRLLSGGNMQKMILGRALAPGPKVILANQPVRGLDIGAVTFVHSQLIAARDAGAAVLLISEDLDEIMALSDVIHVIYEGHLSPGFARGSKTPAELGVWMAGQGFDGAHHAA
jgi:simple sugar transport system ATP-binding protein